MLISPALAQAGGADAAPGFLEAFLPIILIFVVFYFLLIRPQQKKMKHHREMLASVKRGDRIVTGGGIVGSVTKVIDDTEVLVEIADGVRVRVQRGLIAQVLAKTQPIGETTGDGGRRRTRGASADDADDGADAAGAATTKPQGSGSKLKKLLGGKNE